MSQHDRPPSTARPVALGCTLAAATVAFIVFIAVLGIAFLDSGADSGETVLEDARAYAPGSIEFIASRNFYLVRLGDGTFLALSNLDAENRRGRGRLCRVAPIVSDDPNLAIFLRDYALRISTQAAGATVLFREDCHGAVYDVAGLRLDRDGPNLERHPVSTRSDGRLVVDVSERLCSQRLGSEPFAAVPCEPQRKRTG